MVDRLFHWLKSKSNEDSEQKFFFFVLDWQKWEWWVRMMSDSGTGVNGECEHTVDIVIIWNFKQISLSKCFASIGTKRFILMFLQVKYDSMISNNVKTVIPLNGDRIFAVCVNDSKCFERQCPKDLKIHYELHRCRCSMSAFFFITSRFGPLDNLCISQPCL